MEVSFLNTAQSLGGMGKYMDEHTVRQIERERKSGSGVVSYFVHANRKNVNMEALEVEEDIILWQDETGDTDITDIA